MSLLHRTELNLSSEEGDERPPDGTGYSFGSLADIYVKDEEKSNLVANLPRSYTNGDYACVFFKFLAKYTNVGDSHPSMQTCK